MFETTAANLKDSKLQAFGIDDIFAIISGAKLLLSLCMSTTKSSESPQEYAKDHQLADGSFSDDILSEVRPQVRKAALQQYRKARHEGRHMPRPTFEDVHNISVQMLTDTVNADPETVATEYQQLIQH